MFMVIGIANFLGIKMDCLLLCCFLVDFYDFTQSTKLWIFMHCKNKSILMVYFNRSC